MEAITERLKKIMDEGGFTPAQMADRIGVQRSAISHILSGRNKPSLDFVLKVLESFPEVSSEWLLRGQKTDPKMTAPIPQKETPNPAEISPRNSDRKSIEKVLILYTDKTVEEYRNL